jgi:hypothetical protein
MPRFSVVLLAALLGGCDEVGLAPAAPPRLAFAETTYDFGRVVQGTPVEHRFALTNQGGTDLTIMNLRTAYDCQATLIGGAEIAPQGAGAVQARFDSGAVYGPQRRTITVYSNDPSQRAVMLTVTGEVLLDVAADPPRVYLGVVPPGAPALRAVALRAGSDGVHIGPPQVEAPQLTVQLADAADGDAAALLMIGTARDAPSGPFSATVRVPTTSPSHPVLRIAVTGIIAADAPTPRTTPLAANGGAADNGRPDARTP